MKVFCGRRNTGEAGPGEVFKNGKPFTADRSLKIQNKSPTGFQWGYGGSGPAQLALALLLDVVGRKAAEFWFQDFKRQIVIRWTDAWVITDEDIRQWYEMARKETGRDESELDAVADSPATGAG